MNVLSRRSIEFVSSAFPPDFEEAASCAILNVSLLAFTEYVTSFGAAIRPLSTSCAICPCLKNYHATITNGILTETLVSTSSASQTLKPYDNPLDGMH
ncbi:hypothetical protein B0T14DRAFT_564187 [Immersiella caudata]|uniref:Uncharacterized protein n=1 Tax=Immersiella caudata TaxID=314043 RepID=A0AA39WWA1_9PEZI|nr:hypothetical protein B0T14DRAFT_564187 [Immersiella caudata]